MLQSFYLIARESHIGRIWIKLRNEKFPSVSVLIIQLFLKIAMFKLYYLYSNTTDYLSGGWTVQFFE